MSPSSGQAFFQTCIVKTDESFLDPVTARQRQFRDGLLRSTTTCYIGRDLQSDENLDDTNFDRARDSIRRQQQTLDTTVVQSGDAVPKVDASILLFRSFDVHLSDADAVPRSTLSISGERDDYGSAVPTTSLQAVSTVLQPLTGQEIAYNVHLEQASYDALDLIRGYLCGWEELKWDLRDEDQLIAAVCASALGMADLHYRLMAKLRVKFIEDGYFPHRSMVIQLWIRTTNSAPERKLVLDALYLHLIVIGRKEVRKQFLTDLGTETFFQTWEYEKDGWLFDFVGWIYQKLDLRTLADGEDKHIVKAAPSGLRNISQFHAWMQALHRLRTKGHLKDAKFFTFIQESLYDKKSQHVHYQELKSRNYLIVHSLPMKRPKATDALCNHKFSSGDYNQKFDKWLEEANTKQHAKRKAPGESQSSAERPSSRRRLQNTIDVDCFDTVAKVDKSFLSQHTKIVSASGANEDEFPVILAENATAADVQRLASFATGDEDAREGMWTQISLQEKLGLLFAASNLEAKVLEKMLVKKIKALFKEQPLTVQTTLWVYARTSADEGFWLRGFLLGCLHWVLSRQGERDYSGVVEEEAMEEMGGVSLKECRKALIKDLVAFDEAEAKKHPCYGMAWA